MDRHSTVSADPGIEPATGSERLPWRVSLVLPVCNQEARIEEALTDADQALRTLAAEYEILVVDDGSRDGTAEAVVEAAVERPHIRLLRHERPQGMGAALRSGMGAARFDLIVCAGVDGRVEQDLQLLLPLAEASPVVVGHRHQGQETWPRRLLSWGSSCLTRFLLGTGVRDCYCPLKVFRREALDRLQPQSDGPLIHAEMLVQARQLQLDVAEVGLWSGPGDSREDGRPSWRALLSFWWSRVLFPAASPTIGQPGAAGSRRATCLSLVLLLVVAILLFGSRLRAPLLEPQEPRYAEIPRQMLVQGEWLVPVLHGEPYLDKPPLLYWLVMGSYLTCGVHDWAARLVPGLAGVLTVLVTFLWGRQTLGGRAGLCGALCLCLMAGFVYRMRMLGIDSLLCLWITAGLATAHLAIGSGKLRWSWWLAAALACGLGLLTKGPVALVLLAVPVVVYLQLERRAARVSLWGWVLFVAVAAGLAAPWYGAVIVRQPSFAHSFFWTHHVERFLTPFDHSKPSWFYLPVLALTLLPWTLLLPGLVRFLRRQPLRQALRRPMALGYCLLAGLWCVVFFSLAGCKRPGYVLPALPALALALGCYIDCWVPARLSWTGLWTVRCRVAQQLAVALLVMAMGVLVLACGKGLLRPSTVVPMGLATLLGLGMLSCWRRLSWASLAAICFVVLFVAVVQLLPGYNRQFALRGLRREHPSGACDVGPIVCYPQRWDSVSFYLPHAQVRVFGRHQHGEMIAELQSRPRTLVVTRSGKATQELARALPPSLELVIRGRAGALTTAWVRRCREAPPPVLLAEGRLPGPVPAAE